MNHNQELPLAGHPYDHETLFTSHVIRVRNCDGERITEYGSRVSKSDVMLSPVSELLLRMIPGLVLPCATSVSSAVRQAK
jgi:hypothetical protein